jgi:hypothetical protein
VIAGILGVICAITILGLAAIAQGGGTFAPALNAAITPSATSSSASPSSQGEYAIATSSSTTNSRASPGVFGSLVPAGPSSNSAQTIGSPSLPIGNVVLLGIVSLIVSLGVVFAVSRRVN